jgi:hypothetical protein
MFCVRIFVVYACYFTDLCTTLIIILFLKGYCLFFNWLVMVRLYMSECLNAERFLIISLKCVYYYCILLLYHVISSLTTLVFCTKEWL